MPWITNIKEPKGLDGGASPLMRRPYLILDGKEKNLLSWHQTQTTTRRMPKTSRLAVVNQALVLGTMRALCKISALLTSSPSRRLRATVSTTNLNQVLCSNLSKNWKPWAKSSFHPAWQIARVEKRPSYLLTTRRNR